MMQHLTHAGLPADLTRWQLLRLVETARRPLGLSKSAVGCHAIGLTTDGDFAKDRICAFWASVTEIAASLSMERRQITRIEAELIERGLIHKSSTNRSRLGLIGAPQCETVMPATRARASSNRSRASRSASVAV